MIGIFQGSPKGRADECQRRAKGGHGRATSKKQGKRRAPSQKQGSLAAMAGTNGILMAMLEELRKR